MATILDDQFAQGAVATTVTSIVNGNARREIYAAADAEERLSETREQAAIRRAAANLSNRLLDNRMISDQTGEENSYADMEVLLRAAQNQPNQQTYSDPNYRPGAPPPTAA